MLTYANLQNEVLGEEIEDNELKKLELEIAKVDLEISKIDNALNVLNPVERQLIESRFFNNNTWYRVSMELGYSESGVRRFANRVLKKIKDIDS